MINKKRIWPACIILVLLLCNLSSSAQGILDRRVSFNVNRQRLDDVLAIVSNKANFSFSYNSNILKRDSLVNLSIDNKTVRQVLNLLFNGNYEYKESGNYVILRRVSLQLTTVTKTEPAKESRKDEQLMFSWRWIVAEEYARILFWFESNLKHDSQ